MSPLYDQCCGKPEKADSAPPTTINTETMDAFRSASLVAAAAAPSGRPVTAGRRPRLADKAPQQAENPPGDARGALDFLSGNLGAGGPTNEGGGLLSGEEEAESESDRSDGSPVVPATRLDEQRLRSRGQRQTEARAGRGRRSDPPEDPAPTTAAAVGQVTSSAGVVEEFARGRENEVFGEREDVRRDEAVGGEGETADVEEGETNERLLPSA
uniref:Uncharacterized protein n=1 Tax=Chromera velia CCMP2878 TaxID=1169474 RepID=A0A0G4GB53_9ALVE|eukprot:Cvel_4412.t1-p1 / transcript=Cvel_4412.t1 / gene=Cvel_4412 / organism=Chromera_velia_CCMP2878 / gene_product=hypothetical protein / transcript_product=hypothetical protein / location=Cvel_scaffold192:11570-12205(+) / protein_length=212 / sequence_SO=supercontig / SO=protein_coding / is_pseudo=false